MPKAMPSAHSAPSSSVPAPGRIMISTPRKPTAVALQRRQRTLSPKSRTAKTMMNSGVVKVSAMKSASGIRVRPTKPATTAAPPKMPRIAWMPGWRLLTCAIPVCQTTGSSAASATAVRRKAS